MERVIRATPFDGYRLKVEFSDGTKGVVDLKTRLFGPVFEPLKDESYFRQVQIDSFGVICWPNGADLAPDALYETLRNDVTAT